MEFSNRYIALGERFYQASTPTPVSSPTLFLWNKALATQLTLSDAQQQDEQAMAQYFSGNQPLPGAEPVATAYAGHQFGQFNPQLGDGRAHLLGQVSDQAGRWLDIQLKGSGRSAFSRGGDGRCGLGPAVREFVMSEAMKALGVPTTQCLAVVKSADQVFRQRPEPGAVVTRVASSHIRVGSFQFFAANGDIESLEALCEYSIDTHYPEIRAAEGNRYIRLLDSVIGKQIELVVAWMRVGFIHGVMNTDNTAISGETIDYGPCAMMGDYNPDTVFSSIDTRGRYAFGQQPGIVQWNMARFAECLLSLIDNDDEQLVGELTDLINNFPARYQQAYLAMMAGKCGIAAVAEGDQAFVDALLQQLAEQKLDYTISFDLLTQSLSCDVARTTIEQQLGEVYGQWRQRLSVQGLSNDEVEQVMRAANPRVIPRNHQMEAVIKACVETEDPGSALAFLAVLRHPYELVEGTEHYQQAASDHDAGYQTFCGT
ncbi:Protein adenylyltransferase SelO [Sinobacterium norvegicum]|uniref:Protein nucleotidyltransferase YdiU n=1 Tax=Sinobacterium norvegicum TaxID=1641715 RepID=A0ABM9AD59_9GAMM|nr:YdiU family protein [Sinobacterium norvegicum]CAH0991137.1 Protein adenylyltransferase SelO [Sinobacterium norvegicum]